jgi:hypothetical protein
VDSSFRLSLRGPLLVAAAGLVVSAAFSSAYSPGYALVAGVIAGAFLGMVNFASLFRFGVMVSESARALSGNIGRAGMANRDQAGASGNPDAQQSSGRASVAALLSFCLRFPMIALGLAAVARYLGVGGLVLCAVMLFAVQVPLFVGLGRVVYRGAHDEVRASVLLGR